MEMHHTSTPECLRGRGIAEVHAHAPATLTFKMIGLFCTLTFNCLTNFSAFICPTFQCYSTFFGLHSYACGFQLFHLSLSKSHTARLRE